ncbi:hypothetical protein SPRG_09999 [Saprolegnia parasitica CBS 223.65]|uniref:tRNA-binding domain-containing protein n=1 Tax=Saprolegnia parasitica (strain CBS 223.65) TaxID=695850 RepID=A0A067C9K5_SAPPC|nr:hypothetical protein SPRG_09999 [Saprolegnia parasitica CBS 223.65]KDO23191.1 hypothetical protein SPRG_09999 [Saprolegnia parasitica CBS 223.65]|eukprot:XP_012206142.1 hypothetical protein SPRG_09999 [Saprolegnia parasitica CBS 223.65]
MPIIDVAVHQHLLMVHTTTTTADKKAPAAAADKTAPVADKAAPANKAKPDAKTEGKAKKDEKPKKEKKAAAPAPVADAQPDITKLDIRVGKIVKVWKHETADKLYCEEIDVGEDAPRQIASGLVKHYSLEQMEGRMCLVMCNLKPRALVGFKSHGMVLCAPPAAAKPGERIVYEGLTGEPLSPAQVEKQKVLVAAGEGLKSDAHGIAMWKDHKFMTSAGPCSSPSITNGILR